MKNAIRLLPVFLLLNTSFASCTKETVSSSGQPGTGNVSGKVTDTRNDLISGAKITIEHTVWYDSYLNATTGTNGEYIIALPAQPAGDWTAKAQLTKSAYGQDYVFDLEANKIDPFNCNNSTVRNFTWKLSGQRPGTDSYYGAHVDLYQFGTDVDMDKVKLVFTPYPGEDKLIDGSNATTTERSVQDVAGTFMVKDIPIGKYMVKAVYPGKTLLLQNRHDGGSPEVQKTVVFGKYGYLGETEYNIEFWLSE
ncbi:MAG TPA: carboxypeptidase-like regulatory domain-containing protein [Chitinophagaceae bacterium]|jgi:hypothetical protein